MRIDRKHRRLEAPERLVPDLLIETRVEAALDLSARLLSSSEALADREIIERYEHPCTDLAILLVI